ncbi:MAG: hypothetical protein Q8K82_04035 [Gemmatimonadaceae bacterium]|nr:hypothetical protein [Gemmatimonadaceae bacterium]
MSLQNAAHTARALQLVGELLAADGHSIAIVIAGGAAPNLLGIVDRTTTDVDILAFSTPEGAAAPAPTSLREPPDPMPLVFQEAAATAGRSLGLGQGWLNTRPAAALVPSTIRICWR